MLPMDYYNAFTGRDQGALDRLRGATPAVPAIEGFDPDALNLEMNPVGVQPLERRTATGVNPLDALRYLRGGER